MSELPLGTLTMLFTDIEDSTTLTLKMDQQFPEVLTRHHDILRAAFAEYQGQEMDNPGDGFFAVFTCASQAVDAAVQIQKALATEPWPRGVVVRVRIGIHTGEPRRTSEGKPTGMSVVRAARIKEAGHGGQVLLSASTAAIVVDILIHAADDLASFLRYPLGQFFTRGVKR